MYIWKVPPRTHSRLLPHIAECLPIDTIIFQRFYSFFLSGFMSDNETVKFVFRMVLHNHSRIGNNIKLVLYKVALSVNQIRDISSADMCEYLRAEWCYTCKENDIQNGAQIRELILRRDSVKKWILDRNECTHIINNLCTGWNLFTIIYLNLLHLFLLLLYLSALRMYYFMYE